MTTTLTPDCTTPTRSAAAVAEMQAIEAELTAQREAVFALHTAASRHATILAGLLVGLPQTERNDVLFRLLAALVTGGVDAQDIDCVWRCAAMEMER